MGRARQRGDAVDHDGGRAGAGDARAHRVQAFGKVDDFRLARGVLKHGLAVRERRRHHQHMGRADGDLGEHVAVADQALGRAGVDITLLNLDVRAQSAQPVDEQVDRPGTDGAAARQ